jgi:hypothetical protein
VQKWQIGGVPFAARHFLRPINQYGQSRKAIPVKNCHLTPFCVDGGYGNRVAALGRVKVWSAFVDGEAVPPRATAKKKQERGDSSKADE